MILNLVLAIIIFGVLLALLIKVLPSQEDDENQK
ncbi:hypothetical protein BH09BAC1_BH09BAC1_28900 [soil metagenome]